MLPFPFLFSERDMCAWYVLYNIEEEKRRREERFIMIETISNVNGVINGIVWGWPALVLLAFVGVLMTCITKFFQLTHFKHWMSHTIGAIFGDRHVTKHT